MQAYHAKADSAIDLASVDPNTGIAAMQEAEAKYKEVAALVASGVQTMGPSSAAAAEQLSGAQRRAWLLALVAVLAAGAGLVCYWPTSAASWPT